MECVRKNLLLPLTRQHRESPGAEDEEAGSGSYCAGFATGEAAGFGFQNASAFTHSSGG
jgi:hypothetical protein